MLPGLGLFKEVTCPFYKDETCARTSCHFFHGKETLFNRKRSALEVRETPNKKIFLEVENLIQEFEANKTEEGKEVVKVEVEESEPEPELLETDSTQEPEPELLSMHSTEKPEPELLKTHSSQKRDSELLKTHSTHKPESERLKTHSTQTSGHPPDPDCLLCNLKRKTKLRADERTKLRSTVRRLIADPKLIKKVHSKLVSLEEKKKKKKKNKRKRSHSRDSRSRHSVSSSTTFDITESVSSFSSFYEEGTSSPILEEFASLPVASATESNWELSPGASIPLRETVTQTRKRLEQEEMWAAASPANESVSAPKRIRPASAGLISLVRSKIFPASEVPDTKKKNSGGWKTLPQWDSPANRKLLPVLPRIDEECLVSGISKSVREIAVERLFRWHKALPLRTLDAVRKAVFIEKDLYERFKLVRKSLPKYIKEIDQVGTCLNVKIEIPETNVVPVLTEDDLYNRILAEDETIDDIDELEFHSFPINHSGIYSCTFDEKFHYNKKWKYIIKALSRGLRYCYRCNREFSVNEDGEQKSKGCYSHGQNRMDRTGQRNASCGCDPESRGCIQNDYHLTYDHAYEDIQGVWDTMLTKWHATNFHKIVAMDCEMVATPKGLELAKISMVNFNEEVIYESLCKPEGKVIDYLSEFSGMTPEVLASATKPLWEVQRDLANIITKETIVIGHGLDSDFRVLKMCHYRVLDTSILSGLHHVIKRDCQEEIWKNSLAKLARNHLGKEIQDGGFHDPAEDAITCLQIAKTYFSK